MAAMSQTTRQPSRSFYIGIDLHEYDSVLCGIDDRNTILERGRIEHKTPIGFEHLLKRYPGCRLAFETTKPALALRAPRSAHRAQGHRPGQGLQDAHHRRKTRSQCIHIKIFDRCHLSRYKSSNPRNRPPRNGRSSSPREPCQTCKDRVYGLDGLNWFHPTKK
jgi:hypothetical protein